MRGVRRLTCFRRHRNSSVLDGLARAVLSKTILTETACRKYWTLLGNTYGKPRSPPTVGG
jgi:hypothetical protein